MSRKSRTRGPIPGPRLALEAARGDADFESHLVANGGFFQAVAVIFGANDEDIADRLSSVSEALRAAYRSEWHVRSFSNKAIVIDIRAVAGDRIWIMQTCGSWTPTNELDEQRRAA